MFKSIQELVLEAKKQNLTFWQMVLEMEMKNGDLLPEEIMAKMKKHWDVMLESAEKGFETNNRPDKTLITGVSKKQIQYSHMVRSLCGRTINIVMARALSCSEVNCTMGKICAAPTAGSCGILPAVLLTMMEAQDYSEQEILCALLSAAGIGLLIAENATLSGAEGGCQAECGVAAAMAAAAAVQLSGGDMDQMMDAGAFALMNVLGLVCDPVAGLVQVPCAYRNASQAVNAMLSADLALAGNQSPIPIDEVIEAMYQIGRSMSESLRETAMGGLAATITGRGIETKLKNEKTRLTTIV